MCIDNDELLKDLRLCLENAGVYGPMITNAIKVIEGINYCNHRLIPLVIDPLTNGYQCIDCGEEFEAFVSPNHNKVWASKANEKLESDLAYSEEAAKSFEKQVIANGGSSTVVRMPNTPTAEDIVKTSGGFWNAYDKAIDLIKGKNKPKASYEVEYRQETTTTYKNQNSFDPHAR